MYAVIVINIEASLAGKFHYFIPSDLRPTLRIGHLVEISFGQRLAQGIVIGLDDESPVEETKPIIAIIDTEPVVQPWQIELARKLSDYYLTPLNACLRLMLPPGLTRWADVTFDINPNWDGSGRLTQNQRTLIELLQKRGDLRGRQIARAMPSRSNWRSAANQLVRRDIIRKASILDPPRVKPKTVRTARLLIEPYDFILIAQDVGRANKQAEILYYLLATDDPLPSETTVLEATGAKISHIEALYQNGYILRIPPSSVIVPLGDPDDVQADYSSFLGELPKPLDELVDSPELEVMLAQGWVQRVEQPDSISLAVSRKQAIEQIFELKQAGKYLAILIFLAQDGGPVILSELYEPTDSKLSHVRRLEALGAIKLGREEVWRDPLSDRDFVPSVAPQLTADQSRVWSRIRALMLEHSYREVKDIGDGRQDSNHSKNELTRGESILPAPRPVLLHGVTGSGKTEIYMRAVELALQMGRQAIVLVPEIALTPQTVRRFAARFPDQVAVLHSRLSDGERYDTWRRARQKRFSIVIGPRSALFTPFSDIGVIIVDEEHDNSYKQTPPVPPPYYHARDVAVWISQLTGAAVIAGSATPDLVTYHQAQAGRYELLELPQRIMGHRQRIEGQAQRMDLTSSYYQDPDDPDDALHIPLPPVQIVDLRQELRSGNRSIFSRALQKEIDATMARGEQVILFLNRRGTSTFVMCRDCGLVLNCPRCDMPLTYHRPGAMLVCHHCGRQEPPHQQCPQCGSKRIKYFGLGTEEVQRLVQLEWPEARTVRWDRDTTTGRDTHETLLASFINHEADILIGTQMIAKGLDLPLVTLVGVISADVSLGLPDHGIGERTFQVLTQVAGRAGRGLLGGRVIIQTYQPEHYAIQAAAAHDYTTFYLEEIRFRTRHNLPPFRRMARLIIADPVDARAEREAKQLAKALRVHAHQEEYAGTQLFGPVPPFFHRIDGRYRWQIIIRAQSPTKLLKDFPVPSNWIVDIDPVSTL